MSLLKEKKKMEKRIVRIQKLNDIDQDDWKITFEDGIFINKKHSDFFELVERGIELQIQTQREIKMTERPRAEETSVIFEQDDEVRKLEKEKVKKFREDVSNLSLSKFNKKYTSKEMGDTKNE